jgi:hypothetical protein
MIHGILRLLGELDLDPPIHGKYKNSSQRATWSSHSSHSWLASRGPPILALVHVGYGSFECPGSVHQG